MSTRNDEPERASRPFDMDRDGFVLGEGAGRAGAGARRRGRGPRRDGSTAGWPASDARRRATTSSPPHPEGEGPARAIGKALRDAGSTAADIGHVNAHATSTPVGDIAEATTIRGPSATPGGHRHQGETGHMLGAAGALEAVATHPRAARPDRAGTGNLDDPDDEAAIQASTSSAENRARHVLRRAQRLVRVRRPQHGAGLHDGVSTDTAALTTRSSRRAPARGQAVSRRGLP